MTLMKAIKNRRSIRKYKKVKISNARIKNILEAGRWAPSGLNNQPWRFVVIKKKDMIEKIAGCTLYKNTASAASLLIAVFLDNSLVYNRTKDCQAIGACVQNMLLTIHGMKLGACWLGEILNSRKKVEKMLKVPKKLELMAVISVGKPAHKRKSSRVKLDKLVYKNIF